MFSHQAIQFVDGPAMNGTTTFSGEDLFSQPFPQFPHSLDNLSSLGRFSPLLAKICHITRSKQVGGLKPQQESAEIREQLSRFTVLDWTRVQKI
jgi:hypothetical protein